MELKLVRQPSNEICTHGDLYIDDQWAMVTLEDPVREAKIPGKTAIWAGRYQVIVTHSPRFKRRLPLLLNVRDFTGIRIHPLNFATQSDGCIGVGRRRQDDSILESVDAFEELMTEIEAAIQAGEQVWITIE